MAAFLETGIDYSRIDDLPYMRRYIMLLNDDLRYMFNNLDPEDNFSEEGLKSYKSLDDSISEFKVSLDGLDAKVKDASENIGAGIEQMDDEINLYVTKGNVTSAINLSTDVVTLQASNLHITADNFNVNGTTLKAVGEMIATGGYMGGFSLEKDSAGKEYLKGGSGSKLSSGTVYGATGDFGSLTCNNGEIVMNNDVWYMWSCRIDSSGLEFTDGFEAGSLDIARYNSNDDIYTAWYPLTCRNSILAEDIHVGRNGDDSGQVRCYSVYSYFEGAEKPDPYGDEFSDRRIKRNIHVLNGDMACEVIKESKPVSYRLMGDDTSQLGLIAQDVLEIEREYGDMGIVSECDGYYTLDYNRYIPIIAAALRTCRKEIGIWQCMKAG